MLEYIKDIDLIKDIEKYDVILVGTNTYQVMGNGFQRKIRMHYPVTYEENLKTKYGDKSKLGSILRVNTKPIICLCFITHYYNARPDLMPDYLDYEALESCLSIANSQFRGLRVATTFIGCSKFDGNGDRDRVKSILEKHSGNINLFIYDYVQIKRNIEQKLMLIEIFVKSDYDRETKLKMYYERAKDIDRAPIADNYTTKKRKMRADIRKIIGKK